MNDSPTCLLCDEIVDEDAHCYGCGHYICEDCDIHMPVGAHSAQDHIE